VREPATRQPGSTHEMKKNRPAAYAGQQQPRIRRRQLVGLAAPASGKAAAKTDVTARREAVGWLGKQVLKREWYMTRSL